MDQQCATAVQLGAATRQQGKGQGEGNVERRKSSRKSREQTRQGIVEENEIPWPAGGG